jgi:heme oxygenase
LEVLLAKYPGNKVAEFCTHIRQSVNKKPWTLVSYAWCFYMAIFSGGRWIRGGLLKAPPGFWPAQDDAETLGLDEQGLSFWHFPGTQDGEDIKAEFKTRLAAAEGLFTPDERVDIIEEAKEIFRLSATLVEELDEMVGTHLAKVEAPLSIPYESKTSTEKEALIETSRADGVRTEHMTKQSVQFKTILRRPEVTGMLVAMGCLACVALLKFQ